MSYYDDDRPRRQRSTRDRSRRDDYDDTVYDSNVKETRIVKRRDSSSDDEFADRRGHAVYRETTVRRQGHRPIRARSEDDRYHDDRYDDRSYDSRRRDDDSYTVAASRKERSYYDHRDDRRHRRHHSYSERSSSRSRSRSRSRSPPPKKERRKSTVEEALGALGLAGIIGAVTGKKDKSRSRSRSGDRDRDRRRDRSRARGSSSDRSRARSKSRGPNAAQVSQALKAAVLAGAGEAFRARGTPGGWGGEKGKRVLTAALAAGGVDGLISSNRDPDHHQKRDIVGSALAGLAANRVINGPRSKSRGPGKDGSPDGRGRSPSRGVADLAAGGVIAATAKKLIDKARSRSRGRNQRSRSRSSSSDGRYDRAPPKRSRSRSLAARGLAAVGLKDQADKLDPERRRNRRDYDDYYSDDGRSGRNGGYGYNDTGNVGTTQPHQNGQPYGAARSMSLPRAPPHDYELDYGPRHTGDPDTDSDSDLGSSSGDEKQKKKSRKKLLLTGGLATIATIHAANTVYNSMEKREARRKALREGDISPEQAKKEKNKNRVQDAASVGIAALGIKGAYSEWQETRNKSKELEEEWETRKRHAAKREARRRKASMVGTLPYSDSGFSGSLPNLGPQGPYTPSLYHQPQPQPPYNVNSSFIYSDDNPYGAITQHPYVPTPPPGSFPPQPYSPNGGPPR